MNHLLAKRIAQEDVEKALMDWGRLRLVMDQGRTTTRSLFIEGKWPRL